MTTVELLTIIALVLGPVSAVIITRIMDHRRSIRDRRLDVFRTLMRTRRNPTWPDHVNALNLVDVEFRNVRPVLDAWEELLGHFAEDPARSRHEVVAPDHPPEERNARDRQYNVRVAEERQRLLAKLLHSMAKNLGYKIEQLDIFEGGYSPEGWQTIELQQEAVRLLFLDIYLGRRGLPMETFVQQDSDQPAIERAKALLSPEAPTPETRPKKQGNPPVPAEPE